MDINSICDNMTLLSYCAYCIPLLCSVRYFAHVFYIHHVATYIVGMLLYNSIIYMVNLRCTLIINYFPKYDISV